VVFTLGFDGNLPSGTSPRLKEKWEIRDQLNYQLAQLWQAEPILSSHLKHLDDWEVAELHGEQVRPIAPHKKFSRVPYRLQLGGACFVPLVTAHSNLWCHLDILMLRDGDPGHILTGPCTDLDNRLKTLFDGLRMPRNADEMKKHGPPASEKPYFCLLEDDKLITRIAVDTQRRLKRRNEHDSHVELRIGVRVVARKVTDYNMAYLGG